VAGTIAIGSKGEHCVPDVAVLRPGYEPQWNVSAALVIEIVSPNDDTWEKLPFYAAHEVDELLIVDPAKHEVSWLGLEAEAGYRPLERSRLIELGPADLVEQIDWPE